MKKFLLVFTATSLLFSLLLCLGSYYKKIYLHYFSYYPYLEEHQFRKLTEARGLDTVFIGDSSLGNGIDARLFDELCRTKSLNLALTGVYGYFGDVNMLLRVLKNNAIKNVIVVHTLDMLSRRPDFRAQLTTCPSIFDSHFSLAENALFLKTFVLEMLDLKSALSGLKIFLLGEKLPMRPDMIQHDYHRQKTPYSECRTPEEFSKEDVPAKVDEEQLLLLRVLEGICRARNLNCVYAYGPLLDQVLRNSSPMVALSSAAIRSTGITLVTNAPIPIPFDKIGDSTDHVTYTAKDEFTRLYAAKLLPHLYVPSESCGAARN